MVREIPQRSIEGLLEEGRSSIRRIIPCDKLCGTRRTGVEIGPAQQGVHAHGKLFAAVRRSSAERGNIGVLAHALDDSLQPVRLWDAIRIQRRDPFARSGVHCGVLQIVGSLAWRPNELEAWENFEKIGRYLAAILLGLAEEKFHRLLKCLCREPLHGSAEGSPSLRGACAVVADDGDRES